jgi:ectoine hydroxylase-related dioxygenase (phytanoyl-CoA dioxygenase family)
LLSQSAIINGWSKRPEDVAGVQVTERFSSWTPSPIWSVPQPDSDPYARDRWVVVEARDDLTIYVAPGTAGLVLADPDKVAETIPLRRGEKLVLCTNMPVRFSDEKSATYHFAVEHGRAAERSMAADLETWHAKGYCMIKGALPQQSVNTLRNALDDALAQDIATTGLENLVAWGQLGALRNLSDLDQVFLDLLEMNSVFMFLDRVMRKNYVLHAYDGLILGKGEGRFPWDFHTDIEAIRGVAFARGHVPAANVLYYIDDVTEANGATRLVPHSHTALITDPDVQVLADLSIAAVGEPGDALIFDARLWHCAGNNNSSGSRRLIKMMVTEPWIKQTMDYSRALDQRKLEALSPRVRALLGERSRPPQSTEEFRGRRG